MFGIDLPYNIYGTRILRRTLQQEEEQYSSTAISLVRSLLQIVPKRVSTKNPNDNTQRGLSEINNKSSRIERTHASIIYYKFQTPEHRQASGVERLYVKILRLLISRSPPPQVQGVRCGVLCVPQQCSLQLSANLPSSPNQPPTRKRRAALPSTHLHILTLDMPRLAVLISGCSLCLVASWAFVAIRQQNEEALAPRPLAKARVSLDVERKIDEGGALAKKNAARLKADLLLPGGDAGALDHGKKPRPAAKKKKAGVRGVMVDRNNVVETVEMDDLRAPPGRLWIPAAVSGPVNMKDGGDPLFNVLVAYCQLDMKSYHESPWLFAMGPFHQRTSGCLDDESLTRTYRLSSLKVSCVRQNQEQINVMCPRDVIICGEISYNTDKSTGVLCTSTGTGFC